MSNSQPWDYFPMIPVFAFTSLKKARKFVRKRTGLEYEATGRFGQCTYYDGPKGFIVIRLDCADFSPMKKHGILAHECVHYAQYYADEAGTTLDDESYAYIVQAAVSACIDQIGEEWFTTQLQPKPKNQKKTD